MKKRMAFASVSRRQLVKFALLALSASGCTPILPFHFTETAEVLHRGETSLQVAAGGGGGGGSGYGGGGLRFRAGIGDGQEVGLEATGIGWQDAKQGAYGAKLTWKLSLAEEVAVLASAGALYTESLGPAAGGDLGMVVSSATRDRPIGVYSGVRLSLAVPIRSDPLDHGGVDGTVVVPLGLSLGARNSPWRFYIEGGFLGTVIHGYPELDNTKPATTSFAAAGYGAAGLTYQFRN
jgi:hypothetical protein